MPEHVHNVLFLARCMTILEIKHSAVRTLRHCIEAFVIECSVALRLFSSSVLRHVCRYPLLVLRVKAVAYKPSRGVPALVHCSVGTGQ
jgi:hypothetical protein